MHLLWAGEEAVLIFFVLSGFVLALPASRRPIPWRSYYPRRLVRLYVPVWGALLFAALVLVAVPRTAATARSGWLNERAEAQGSDVWHDALLLDGSARWTPRCGR